MTANQNRSLSETLWKIYRRPERPLPWENGGNLPWNDPTFSARMLREHLDDSNGAATRITPERTMQLEWLWETLVLRPGMRLLDITCGPGLYAVELARRGCQVTGIDFSPASIDYARDLARSHGVSDRCTFVEQDVRQIAYQGADFDVALFTYGQLAVFPVAEAQVLLTNIAQALRPGGRLCIELLDQAKVDKTNSTWWFTDDTGLWGERPFLHLGERVWYATEQISVERFYIVHLETGELTEITLSDQTYAIETMVHMLEQAGFQSVDVHPAWDGLPLYDAEEWVVYVAER